MGKVRFFRGPKSAYFANLEKYTDAIYFTTDDSSTVIEEKTE